MTPREQYETILQHLKHMRQQRFDVQDQFWAELHEALGAHKTLKKVKDPLERRLKAANLLGEWGFQLIQQRFVKPALQRLQQTRAEINWDQTQLKRLAPKVPLTSGPDWNLVETVHGSNYHTQGFGADRYAEGRAKLLALPYKVAGIPVRVRQEDLPRPKNPGRFYVHTSKFHVEAQTDSVIIDVMSRRPMLTLKEQIKMCWKIGVNPRVYNPWLPHGLEAKLGLDYFGNELGT